MKIKIIKIKNDKPKPIKVNIDRKSGMSYEVY